MATIADCVHQLKPPCDCAECVKATTEADQRRAEIEAILQRLDETEAAIALEVNE